MKDKNKNRKGYKKTKVGWIPEEWGCVKLGNISEICRGGSPRPISDYITESDEGFNWLRIGDVHKDSKYINSTHEKIKKEGLKYTTLVNKNELILSNSMSFGRPFVLKVNTCIHDGWLALRKISKCVVTDFLYNILSSSRTQVRFDCIAAGSGVRNLKISTVILLQIPLPPLPEQKAIASVLECWDKSIQKYEEKIEKKKNIKKGLMQKLLSGEQRLPGFDEAWEEVELDNLGSFSKGKGISRNDTVNSGLPCIRYGEIYTTEAFVLNKFESCISQNTAQQSKKITKNELLFACSGETLEDIGKSIAYMGTTTAYAGGDIVVFSPHDNNVGCDFLAYYFNTQGRSELRRRGQGQSVVHIYSKHLKEIALQLPGRDEQKAIASVLSSADSEIKVLEKKLALLCDQKKYLLNNLVTGTIRLPEFCKEVG